MPTIFRAMKEGEEGKPVVEASAKNLGVRSAGSDADVDLDDLGRVVMNAKGMSVAPSWRALPFHRIPERLRFQVPNARGSNVTRCFRFGEGPFADGTLSVNLELMKDSAIHGVVAPASLTQLEQFQHDLAQTREFWTIDED